MTTRGIPQILYGTEINLRGGEEHVEVRQDFPGGFIGDKRNAFKATQRTIMENKMWHFIQQLIGLRKKYSSLSSGKMTHYPISWDTDIYKYFKILGDEKILVILNGKKIKQSIDFKDIEHQFAGYTHFKNLFSNNSITIPQSLTLDKWTVKIYLLIR